MARILYATNWKSNEVSAFRLVEGTLQEPPRLFPVADGALNPLVAVVSPTRRHLYISNWGSGNVSAYRIDAWGALVPQATVTPAEPRPTNTAGLVIAPDGEYLFAAAFNGAGPGTISSFAIDPDGTPRPLATVPAQGAGSAGAALAPNGSTLYVANMTSGDVSVFAIRRAGSLRWLQTVPAGEGTFFPATTTDGRLLVVANASSNDLSVFDVDHRGRLQPIGHRVPSGGIGPRGIVISPSGRDVYVAHYNDGKNPGSVAAFTLSPTGRLNPVGDVVRTGSNGAEAMVLDPSARRLYVANFNTAGPGNISTFELHREGGVRLVGEPTLTGGEEPDFGGLVIVGDERD